MPTPKINQVEGHIDEENGYYCLNFYGEGLDAAIPACDSTLSEPVLSIHVDYDQNMAAGALTRYIRLNAGSDKAIAWLMYLGDNTILEDVKPDGDIVKFKIPLDLRKSDPVLFDTLQKIDANPRAELTLLNRFLAKEHKRSGGLE
jgi:hypothetical protein